MRGNRATNRALKSVDIAASTSSSSGDPTKPRVDGNTVGQVVAKLAASQPFSWTACLGDVGQIIEDWRVAIIDDLGGDEEVTAMQRIVVDAAIRTQVILDVLDQYILNPSAQKIIDIEHGSAHFIIIQRKMYSDSLVRYMQVLGLQRRKKPKNVSRVIEELVAAAEDLDRETFESARDAGDEDESVDNLDADEPDGSAEVNGLASDIATGEVIDGSVGLMIDEAEVALGDDAEFDEFEDEANS